MGQWGALEGGQRGGEEHVKRKGLQSGKGGVIRTGVRPSKMEMGKKALRVPKLSFEGMRNGGRVEAARPGWPALEQTHRDSLDTVRNMLLVGLPSEMGFPPNAAPGKSSSEPSELDHVVTLGILETQHAAPAARAIEAVPVLPVVDDLGDRSLGVFGSAGTLEENA